MEGRPLPPRNHIHELGSEAGYMVRRFQSLVILAVGAAMMLGCGAASDVATYPAGTAAPSVAPCSGAGCQPGPGVRGVRVFVEPDARRAPILDAIGGANTSIWLEVYLLTDTTTIRALEDAAARGVDVRVLLEPSPYGFGSTAPAETIAKLNAAGVHARPADPAFHYTHEKAMLVDNATAFIMTCNLTRSALGGSASAINREYGVIDANQADIAELAAIFQADWNRTTPTLTDPNLVVSPVDARAKLLAVLAAAHSSLQIEDEEMEDARSEDALIAAARRGVAVDVVLPLPTNGAPPSPDLARLAAGGVHIRYSATLYMHAKLIIQDATRAFVGSENFSANSLDDNRELGILIADPAALTTLSATFGTDWESGVHYAA